MNSQKIINKSGVIKVHTENVLSMLYITNKGKHLTVSVSQIIIFTWIAFGSSIISEDSDLIFMKNVKVYGMGKIVVDLNQIVLSKTV